MGNKVGTRRPAVDEKFTRPQGLYETAGVDLKRLRKLIIACKLAPCYPGKEDDSLDLEECPICFMNYPSLNRSRCCQKGICTECYLQLQSTFSGHAIKCPFCKASNLVIEYRGVRTTDEKRMEQIEEQKFIEAVMRKRRQEINDEKEKTTQRQYSSQPSGQIVTTQFDNHDALQNMLPVTPTRRQEHVQRSGLSPVSISVPGSQSASLLRDDCFDVDFEDIMLEEAIWLSLQEQGAGVIGGGLDSRTSQLLDRLTFKGYSSVRHLIPSPIRGRASHRQENVSQIANSLLETGSHHTSSNIREQIGSSIPAGNGMSSSHHLPESFEEELMLAMAISIAEI